MYYLGRLSHINVTQRSRVRRKGHTTCINLYAMDSDGSASGSSDVVIFVADRRVAIGVRADLLCLGRGCGHVAWSANRPYQSAYQFLAWLCTEPVLGLLASEGTCYNRGIDRSTSVIIAGKRRGLFASRWSDRSARSPSCCRLIAKSFW